MNTELLRDIADAIEKQPDRYNQSVWITDSTGKENTGLATIQQIRSRKFTCGATGCVAGHAVVFSQIPLDKYRDQFERDHVNLYDAGMAALDIPPYLAEWLFDGDRHEGPMPEILRAIAAGETDTYKLWRLEYRLEYGEDPVDDDDE